MVDTIASYVKSTKHLRSYSMAGTSKEYLCHVVALTNSTLQVLCLGNVTSCYLPTARLQVFLSFGTSFVAYFFDNFELEYCILKLLF